VGISRQVRAWSPEFLTKSKEQFINEMLDKAFCIALYALPSIRSASVWIEKVALYWNGEEKTITDTKACSMPTNANIAKNYKSNAEGGTRILIPS
jgi:hypothetical protein